MKKIIVLCMSMMLWLPGLVSAQQALQIVRVNTDDVAAYLDWAEDSSAALLGDNVGAIGTCVPVFGADDPGDVFFFTVNPNQENLFGLDFNNPVLQQEIAKISDIRRVVSRDVHLTIRQGRGAGFSWENVVASDLLRRDNAAGTVYRAIERDGAQTARKWLR